MWEKMQISDFGVVVTGKTPSSNHPEFFGEAFPFITPTDMGTCRIVETERGISQKGFAKFQRQILPPKSTCFVCIGATIGKVCLTTKNSLTNQQINSVIVDNQRHDPLFVYYLLSTLSDSVKGIAGGAATPIVNKTTFENFEVSAPPLPIQRKIASILSAYDDLIENNQRRINILEEMAQNLYREWFVKFRFPGHEKVKFVDSPMGRIPEGWGIVPFKDLLLSMTGGDWGSDQPTDKELHEVIVIRGTDLPDLIYGGKLRAPIRFITSSSLANRQLKQFDVIIENSVNAKSRCIGTPLFVDDNIIRRLKDDAIAASFCKVFRFHDKIISPIAYMHIRYLREEKMMDFYQNVATNGIGNFQAKRFAERECLPLPTDDSLLNTLSDGIFLKIHAACLFANRISVLRRTRDLLLPKLISGEIDVSDLDIAVPEEVEA